MRAFPVVPIFVFPCFNSSFQGFGFWPGKKIKIMRMRMVVFRSHPCISG